MNEHLTRWLSQHGCRWEWSYDSPHTGDLRTYRTPDGRTFLIHIPPRDADAWTIFVPNEEHDDVFAYLEAARTNLELE